MRVSLKTASCHVPLLLCALLQAGCGGGGGGGGGGSAPAPPTPPPPTSPPPFSLTAGNAIGASTNVLQPMDELLSAVELATFVSFFTVDSGAQLVSLSCADGGGRSGNAAFVDKNGDKKLGPSEQLTITHGSCLGVARRLVVSLDAVDVDAGSLQGTVQVTIDADAQPALHIEGTAAIAVEFFTGTSHFQWSVSSVTLAVTYAGAPAGHMNANMVALLGGRSPSVLIERRRAMSVAPTAAPDALPARLQYQVTASGTLESSTLGGTLSFATQPAFEGTSGGFPGSGELLLTAGASKVRVAPSADSTRVEEFADVGVDTGIGAGYGAPISIEWRSLLRGELFGWAPLRRPAIVDNQILPASPRATDTLVASYQVLNPAGGPVEQAFEWRRNGVLIAGANAAQLAPGAFARGDRIDVTVHVTNEYASDVDTVTTTILNSEPQLSIALLPEHPETTDDLVLDETIHDADGDTLAVTRRWFRNGIEVNDETGTTFPASKQQKGDLINVSVLVRDAEASAFAGVETTIVDSPPRVSVGSTPTVVTYGMPTTFNARIEDDDGDPVDAFRFRVAHGPAGMTVDPVSGRVDWTPNGPMFDRTMMVHWGIASDDPIVGATTGTIEIDDPARDYPLRRSTGFDFVNGLRVGDFDGDGKVETMVLDNAGLYGLERSGATYRVSWAYPFVPSATMRTFALATGDVDGDGRHEIFLGTDSVVKLDGIERRPVASFDLRQLGLASCSQLEYADLDRDGAAEIVCFASAIYDPSVVVLRAADLSFVWKSTLDNMGESLAVGNVDADPALEIIVSRGVLIDGATFATERAYPNGFGFAIAAGDLDGDGIAEIVGQTSEGATVFSAKSGPVTELTRIAGPITRVGTGDVTGDGVADVLTAEGSRVVAYGYDAVARTTSAVFSLDPLGSVNSMAAGDVDRDGKPEIVWGGDRTSALDPGIYIAGRGPDALEWSPDNLSMLAGGALAHAPLAAPAPLFVGSAADSQVLFAMDPSTGDVTRAPPLGTAAVWPALDVADYDQDGTTEALVSIRDGADAHVAVHDFFAHNTDWAPAIDAADGTADFIAHGDLTGDGRDDVAVLTNRGVVYAFDPTHQAFLWKGSPFSFGIDVAIADVDGDGIREIVAATGDAVRLFSRAAPTVYTESARFSPGEIKDMAVGDVDGDGRDEIIVLTAEVVRLGPGLTRLGSFRPSADFAVIAIEASAFPRKNLALATRRHSELITVDPVSGAEVSRSPPLFGEVARNGIHYLDLAGDGKLRLALTGQYGVWLTR